MLDVTELQRIAYNSNSVQKKLLIEIEGLPMIESWQIYEESMTVHECLIEGKNVEFVGCISTEFSIDIKGIATNVKNKAINVKIVHIRQGETTYKEEDVIPLFSGIIDSAKMQGGKPVRHIVAYDKLYTIGQKDVSTWYKNLKFPCDLLTIRTSLLEYLGLESVETELVNDAITVQKQYDPKLLKGLSVLKAICQINGCFGIINREGLFEYRYLKQDDERIIDNEFDFHKKVIHEEFYVKPFERVQIRASENVDGVTVGDGAEGSNKYIIQANMWAYKLNEQTTRTIATNIYNKIKNIAFYPCDTDNNGLPFIECGDTVKYAYSNPELPANSNTFIVLNRELSGIQALRDKYKADGEEEASEYITDLQTQIDTIKQSGGGSLPEDVVTFEDLEDYPTFEETYDLISEEVNDLETPTGFNIISCYTLPSIRKPDTIYLIRGNVIFME